MSTPTDSRSTVAEQAPRRTTRQRAAVAAALGQCEEFVSAQELHARLRTDGERVGLATVYRNLQSMAADGEIDMIRRDDGEAVYRACSTDHHHHLVCRVCGSTVEIAGPAVERWADRVGAEHDYAEVSHTVELTGVCASCR